MPNQQNTNNNMESGQDRLIRLGKELARSHQISSEYADRYYLIEQVEIQEQFLQIAQSEILETEDSSLAQSYAAEWFLDNFYLVQEAIQQIQEDMPPDFYRKLPLLTQDGSVADPRILAVARELIRTVGLNPNYDQISRFVQAYQNEANLKICELWALPTMLRVLILEKLAAVLAIITALPFDNLRKIKDLPAEENKQRALVADCIQGLRSLKNIRWQEFFEAVSQVEQILRSDPDGIYEQMDFNTRDRYRKAVEKLSLVSGCGERKVAEQAVQLAQQAQIEQPNQTDPATKLSHHVGYYLLKQGLSELEKSLQYQPGWYEQANRRLRGQAFGLYLGSILLFSLLFLTFLLGLLAYLRAEAWVLWIAGLLALFPVSAMAVSLVNRLVTWLVPPHPPLAKLDFTDGVPEDHQSLVVIPALLSNSEGVPALLNQIELYFIGNEDDQISFALLTDFSDAPEEHLPGDEALLEQISAGIRTLNQKYARSGQPNFLLLHRDRKWNPSQQVWMGWERKRGKLVELNDLILQGNTQPFSKMIGAAEHLRNVRYVITMDEDTLLPHNTAKELIGTLAHPFNRPVIDPDSQRVLSGYTILQPRLELKPVSTQRSWFSRIFSSGGGISLYSQVVSDVSQDLFDEGNFMGKGIYDVAAFNRSLADQIPENTILSHDLIEGLHGRAGYVSDIVIFESFPRYYLAYAKRIHRWVRGDWQLLPWLVPRLHASLDQQNRARLSALGKWKIADNLRRSLVTPATLILLLFGWFYFPGWALFWTLLILFPLGIPAFPFLNPGFQISTWRNLWRDIKSGLVRWSMSVVFMLYESVLILDAVARTLIRLIVTQKRLLQWTTAWHTLRSLQKDFRLLVTWRRMWSAVSLSSIILLLVWIWRPAQFWQVLPVLVVWFFSPQIAHLISKPITSAHGLLSSDQNKKLRRLARRTWFFFEQFAGPDDHWLCPDHYQEEPRGTVAHRTSPTNIGLGLLSIMAAHDLGYINVLELSVRLKNAFESIDALEKYSGHLLNWYDTKKLRPLSPRYVSSVDSGNFAGSLLALQQGCRQVITAPVLSPSHWQGLLDVLDLLQVSLATSPAGSRSVVEGIQSMAEKIARVQDDPDQWNATIRTFSEHSWVELHQQINTMVEAHEHDFEYQALRELRVWTERVHQHFVAWLRVYDHLLPWHQAYKECPARLGSDEMPVELADLWQSLWQTFPAVAALDDIERICLAGAELLDDLVAAMVATDYGQPQDELVAWSQQFSDELEAAGQQASELVSHYQDLVTFSEELFHNMDFSFLYNERLNLFRIGYNVSLGKLDDNHYDLLASEARLASLIAIAKGDVPEKHWLYLRRPLTQIDQGLALVSWSGSMFEYLMPHLLMKWYPETMIEVACNTVIQKQIDYAKSRGTPWGISESGYYHFDANMNYQYRAFGVPGLGLKRGLEVDLVISPYASLLALPLDPQAVLDNLAHLDDMDMLGLYGYYEALDFTPARLSLAEDHAVVRSFMAHHQGMIMLSLLNVLTNDLMIQRFHADPRIQTFELLLQEQIPPRPHYQDFQAQEIADVKRRTKDIAEESWTPNTDTGFPAVHILSNTSFGTLITDSGAGFTQYFPERTQRSEPLMLTRWRMDTTRDHWGTWIYVQDLENGRLWSVGSQPVGQPADSYKLEYFPAHVEFNRRDGDISTRTAVTVSVQKNVEIRKITQVNHGREKHRLRLTSYGEVVLSDQNSDLRHPAFNKLFVESEYHPELAAISFRRRPSSNDADNPYLVHALVVPEGAITGIQFESERANFVGRGKTGRAPQVMVTESGSLTNTSGAVLDPIMSLSAEIELQARGRQEIAFLTCVAKTKQQALAIVRHYQLWPRIERAFENAATVNAQELNEMDLSLDQLAAIQQLLSVLYYSHPALRAEPQRLAANQLGQSDLWPFAISGDYPILLVRVQSPDHVYLVRDLLRAHRYWRRRGVKIDLVILNQLDVSYDQDLKGQLHQVVTQMDSEHWINQRGGIFLLGAGQMQAQQLTLLETAARAILDGNQGPLKEQIEAQVKSRKRLPHSLPMQEPMRPQQSVSLVARPDELVFDNGYGGFRPDGSEYLIYLEDDQWTPLSWVNVLANPQFGCLLSDAGFGSTWAENSGENRLTPWRNDPLSDPPAEVLYLRNEDTGQVWTPTPLPARADAPYLIRHGAGYSVYQHNSYGLEQEVRVFIHPEEAVKIVQVKLKNTSERVCQITATYYAEWVLGPVRSRMSAYIVPEFEAEMNALLAHNQYNQEFKDRVAFLAASREVRGFTTDRAEFIGRRGDYRLPMALTRVGLSDTVQAGTDPCAALQVLLWLDVGETKELSFILGQGQDRETALAAMRRYRDKDEIAAAWQANRDHWKQILQQVQVETPDPAINIMLNHWLLYQTLSCRLWGRSAYYQSSGAFGFRDQLQDVMALLHSTPELCRQHILRAARCQFEEGDVLHWWHPPSNRGVRTRCSDNMLWLPYVTAAYVEVTGDQSILDEEIPFLSARPLGEDEHERYDYYQPGDESGSLLDHCQRAIEFGSTQGVHGLPLIGAHDWNDGMDRIGLEGEGESVWLGWFLYATLRAFSDLCQKIGREDLVAGYPDRMAGLQQALDAHAWDGEWYLRAYFDDGTPLGSAQNKECQIDSIAQSWAVISQAAVAKRAGQALQALVDRLIKWDDALALLFTPPFDDSALDPGYIQAYPPGVRENGGQYTHAALWAVWALAEQGEAELANDLYRMLNPIYHGDTKAKADQYQVEPYAVAADIYNAEAYLGHGGWTWYTGSAGWMYQVGLQVILGLKRSGKSLSFDPCIPADWPECAIDYRYGDTLYQIRVVNPDRVNRGVTEVILDGEHVSSGVISLEDDQQSHQVKILLG